MAKVVTFGEIMLRLSPPAHQRFTQAVGFDAVYGGAEANVAVSLADFGIDAAFVSKVPAHGIGQAAFNELRRWGVDVSGIVRGGERLGLYFLETGASQRPSQIVYDRAGSAFSQAKSGEFNWDRLLDGADWFHFTGITPALSDNTAALTLEACRAAKARGILVSCDFNYRKNLWSEEKAAQVMGGLMPYVDVLNGVGAQEARAILSVDVGAHSDGKPDPEEYLRIAEKLTERFGLTLFASTLRHSLSADENDFGAMVYDGKNACFSPMYHMHIVDRVGGGDAFFAGLIYARLAGFSLQDTVNFAAAAGCLKHTIPGDANHVGVEEVKKLMNGDGSGRVMR